MRGCFDTKHLVVRFNFFTKTVLLVLFAKFTKVAGLAWKFSALNSTRLADRVKPDVADVRQGRSLYPHKRTRAG